MNILTRCFIAVAFLFSFEVQAKQIVLSCKGHIAAHGGEESPDRFFAYLYISDKDCHVYAKGIAGICEVADDRYQYVDLLERFSDGSGTVGTSIIIWRASLNYRLYKTRMPEIEGKNITSKGSCNIYGGPKV